MRIDYVRIAIALAVLVVSLPLRWLAVFIFRAWKPTLWGRPVARFVLCRTFRGYGWDLSVASWGFFSMALLSPASKFTQLFVTSGQYGHFITIVFFAFFCILFFGAALTRYALLETAESIGERRWICSFPCFVIGSMLIFSTSKMALG